jgi:hypothetical protein
LHNISTAARVILGGTLSSSNKGYMVYDVDLLSPYFWNGAQWKAASEGQWGSITGTLTTQTDLINYLSTTYVPLSRNITINNITQDLSIDRTWTIDTDSLFISDITVSLSGGKTLGRYVTGDVIPSTGKTAEEVITLIAQEALSPTAILTSSSTIAFNQTAISNVLNFSYVINSLPPATIATVSLEWRRNNTGNWSVLSTSTTTPGTFTHTLTDTAFNTQPFNYRYVVTDSIGTVTTATLNITPASYVAPSITFSAPGTITAEETQTSREWGNTASTLQGSCSRNSVNVPITSYQFSVSVNNGAFTNLGSSVSLAAIGGPFTNLPNTQNTDTTTKVEYRVTVTDSFTTTTAAYTINLYSMIFYGPVNAAAAINSALIRGLSKRLSNAANTFSFSTGTTERRFIVAMFNTKTLTSAIDTTINVNLTSNFLEQTVAVNDRAGNARTYKVYVYTNSIPYNPADNIQIIHS